MINAYKQGKDLYATIASGVYKNTYWDNMEHHEDGTPNPDGKKRRSSCKNLLLGIMYGRGVASIAVQIGGTPQEAQKIVDDFYNGFPKVKKWTDATLINARKTGYVEDLWGRRRRLPEIKLQEYEVKYKGESNDNFNPLLGCKGLVQNPNAKLINQYLEKLSKAKNRKEVEAIATEASANNIEIKNNTGFIKQAERQCVNARVQGGAATMSKKAMINVYNDPELNRLGFRLLIAVHDELIGECPKENADAVAERLCDVMKHSAEPECIVPFKCDPTIESSWYYTDYSDIITKEFNSLAEEMSAEEALQQLSETYSECTYQQLVEMIH